MADVTLIFDEFGHQYQPYWLNWFDLLKKGGQIEFDVLANKISAKNFPEVRLLKPINKKQKILNALYLLSKGETRLSKKSIYRNLIEINSPLIHILKAQMYPGLARHIPPTSDLIFSFRGYDTLVSPFSDQKWKHELLKIYNIAKGLHFVSDYIKKEAISLGAPSEKCVTIYRPVDTDFFSPNPRVVKKDKLEILSVGRLTWQKGYIDAIEALSIIKQKGYSFHYTIVGDGPDLDHILFHLRRLHLEDSTTILHHQTREQIKFRYQEADIFLITSVTDALPNVILEASAMELPVIATKVAGIPEAVVDKVSGLLVPSCEPEGIAEAIEHLIKNPDKIANMGISGRLFVNKSFNSLLTTRQWIEYYKKTLQ